MNKKEKANKKNSIINHSLDNMVEDKIKQMTADLLETNGKINGFTRKLDEFFMLIDSESAKFANQRILNGKIASIKRMIYASKIGLERQKLKMYDIDQMAIKEEIIRSIK